MKTCYRCHGQKLESGIGYQYSGPICNCAIPQLEPTYMNGIEFKQNPYLGRVAKLESQNAKMREFIEGLAALYGLEDSWVSNKAKDCLREIEEMCH